MNINLGKFLVIKDYNIFKKPSLVLGLYLFVIFIFSLLYWLLNIPFNHGDKISQLCFSDSLYFSVVTITTLGYGDISPSGEIGKLLTGSEAVSGILILGLFLNSLSHTLAISYQEKLKEKESEIAIKIIYVPNWSEINRYYWGLSDVFKALSKVQLLQQPASESTQEQLNLFKDSLNEFNNTINIYNLKTLEADKEKSIFHLNKLLGNIDPVKHSELLHKISTLKSHDLHVMTKNFITDISQNLESFSKSDTSISTTSASFQHIFEWIVPEIKNMVYIKMELDSITKVKDIVNPDGSIYYG